METCLILEKTKGGTRFIEIQMIALLSPFNKGERGKEKEKKNYYLEIYRERDIGDINRRII